MAIIKNEPISLREMAENFKDDDVSYEMLLKTLVNQQFLDDENNVTNKGLTAGIMYHLDLESEQIKSPLFSPAFQQRMASNIKWMIIHFPDERLSLKNPAQEKPVEVTPLSDSEPVKPCAYKYLCLDNFVILDTETTGLNNDDEVCELGIIDSDGNVLFHSYYYPEKEVDPGAAKVNHLSKEKLAKYGKLNAEEWDKIVKAIGGKVIVGHNIPYDVRLITQSLKKNGYDGPLDALNNTVDTIAIAKRHIKSKSYSLNNLTTLIGITREEQHDAVDDCRMTLEFINRLEDILKIKAEYSFIRI